MNSWNSHPVAEEKLVTQGTFEGTLGDQNKVIITMRNLHRGIKRVLD